MQRAFEFLPEQFYHVYNRGIEKRNIFIDDNDRNRFQHLLYLANGDKPIVFSRVRGFPLDRERGEQSVSLHAYSLMSNHFHLIVSEGKQGGISAFMGKLQTAYSMYFNTKNERTGGLVCKPFRAKLIDNDDYFRWVFSYIHLNPLDLIEPGWKKKGIAEKRKAIDFLVSYRYSSYPDYFGPDRLERKIIDMAALPFDISALETFEEMLAEFESPFIRPDVDIW